MLNPFPGVPSMQNSKMLGKYRINMFAILISQKLEIFFILTKKQLIICVLQLRIVYLTNCSLNLQRLGSNFRAVNDN